MCFILSEHFTGILLFFCMIRYDPLRSGFFVSASSLNASEEIKNIFSLPDVTETVLKGSGNFAEGGVINITHSTTRTSIINYSTPENVTSTKTLPKSVSAVSMTTLRTPTQNPIDVSTIKSTLPTKLTETGSNLFLGVPEVIHINGISSIKPRKGVHFNEIVPRKGVENEAESISESSSKKEECIKVTQNECYNVTGIHGVECNCCKDGNEFGKIVKQQVLVNCKNCKPINMISSEKEVCRNICCSSVVHDIYSESTSQDISNKYLKYETVTKKQENDGNNLKKLEPAGNLTKKMATAVSLNKNSKLKPTMTKVPYDVEIVTELLSKTQQRVFVPIVVSIFLLPLIGILLFFLWRRTKEYWDKRYYKRMDFLIDGIYND